MPAATIIRADHPAYWKWYSAAARGRATILGYSYDRDGTKTMAVTSWRGRLPKNVGVILPADEKNRRNPIPPGQKIEVPWPRRFFTSVLDEYSSRVNMCWVREAIQNSVDAKATAIDITVDRVSSDKWLVTVADNGTGMSEDILYKKFIVPGETGKEGDVDATGGFGDAKRLLFWPWCEWKVFTNGSDGPLAVRGVNMSIESIEAIRATGCGTRIEVVMPEDRHINAYDAESFIRLCYLPHVHFTVNGNPVRADLEKGSKRVEYESLEGDMKLYHSPRNEIHGFYVRQRGLLMFQVETYANFKGLIIGELTKKSTEVLAKNRNELREDPFRVMRFAQTLAINPRSALKPPKNLTREDFKVEGRKAFIPAVMDAKEKIGELLTKHLEKSKLQDSIDQVLIQVGQTTQDTSVFMPTPGVATTILERMTTKKNSTEIEAAIEQLAWPAVFAIINKVPDYKVRSWLEHEKMGPRLRKLATLWMEYCRLILIRLGIKGRFGIGWIFEEDDAEKSGYALAAYTARHDMHWFLLNPFIDGYTTKMENGKRVDGDVYSIRNPEHLDMLFSLAIHECTHGSTGLGDHTEDFSSALTANTAKVLPSTRMMLAIRNAVAARSEQTSAAPAENKSIKNINDNINGLAESVLAKMRYIRDNGGWSGPAFNDTLLPLIKVFDNKVIQQGINKWASIVTDKHFDEVDKDLTLIVRTYIKNLGTADPIGNIKLMLHDMPDVLKTYLTPREIVGTIAVYYVFVLEKRLYDA